MNSSPARVDERVAHWARTRPGAPALRWRGTSVTYAELDARAADLAASVAAHGIGPGDVVAVRMERGPRMAEALLAVLKCGAAYTAVDTRWPEARCRQVTELTGARLLLTDTGTEVLPAAGRTAPEGEALCVFFTSGSTGTPKSVLATHRGLLRIAEDPVLAFDGTTCMLQSAAVPWDAFAMELWAPLVHGGTTVLLDGHYLTVDDCRDAVADGVNTMFATTSLFNAIVDEDPGALRGLRTVMVGGERLSPRHMARALRAVPGTRLVNGYGPVESTVFATVHPVTEVADEDTDIPIGRPVAGTGIHVLDTELRPVAPGEPGELAISGAGLALGYLGDAEATARAFRDLPLGPGGTPLRVYLTGDRARLGADGTYEFLGRADRQVKIRGVRVEPGEVERAAEDVPGIARAVVLPLPLDGGPSTATTGLAMVCVPATEAPAGAGAVREAVAAQLPAAFVPDPVVMAKSLPLTGNGKLDRAALARTVRAELDRRAAADTTPTGPVPPRLATVLTAAADLLGRPVTPDTNLFEAGATSITAMRLAGRLTTTTGTRLTAPQVMLARTPTAIAALLGPDEQAPQAAAAPETSPRWISGLPAPQWRFWFTEQRTPGSADALSSFLFRTEGPVDADRLAAAVHAVAARHEVLRTTLTRGADRTVTSTTLPATGLPPLLTVLTPAPERDARRAAEEHLARPFDLAAEVPLRTVLAPSGNGNHWFGLVVHHSAFDGWSAGLLLRELSDAYAGSADDRPAPGYAHAWTEQFATETEADRAALREWTRELRGVPDLPLGSGAPAPAGPVARIRIDVPAPLRTAAAGTTVAATLLAAWVRALRTVTGATDFAVGIPVAGRASAAAEQAVGCFASGVAVRFRGPADDVLAESTRQLAQALRFQFQPVEALLREDTPRDPHRNPYCQAGFVMQNTEPPRLVLDSRTFTPERPAGPETSAYELTLEVPDASADHLTLRYRTDVLDETRAQALAKALLDELARPVSAASHPRPAHGAAR
ncbi:amino acid adenylation domain-containing protein [Streptomyces sp. ET3-23]|uniref:non-ribosomal peptide synthetase n=1 Tax=Streptomyces sp. ET3-23 TaxID=2885643 RepID=UPI001D0FE723|nr:non-ribosomal peptide synthetase [Streptomyces sp. ET3-23]MCC2274804.1 amino acid adenylation domain-containing protein [Streptomyces sp. ET3-23]